MEPNDICPSCKNPINTEVCWCGDLIEKHGIGDGHSPVEMGCTCYYDDKENELRYLEYLRDIT